MGGECYDYWLGAWQFVQLSSTVARHSTGWPFSSRHKTIGRERRGFLIGLHVTPHGLGDFHSLRAIISS
jgi:hypothetical protein